MKTVELKLRETKTYDVIFQDDIDSNSKGFEKSYEYCLNWINNNRNFPGSYFEDYDKGQVFIICNETNEPVYYEDIDVHNS